MDITLQTDCFLKTPLQRRWTGCHLSFSVHISRVSHLLFVHIHCRINSMHKDGNKVVLSFSSHIWSASCQSHLCNTFFRHLLAEISSLTIRHSDMTIPPSSPRGFRSRGIYTLLLHLLLFRTAGFFFNCCLDAKAPTSGSCFSSTVTSSILRSFLWFRYI